MPFVKSFQSGKFPFQISYVQVGPLEVSTGRVLWVCEFPSATIVGCRAALGRDSVPSSQSVIVDVNKGTGATPTFTTIFTNQGNRPTVPVGITVGNIKVPDVTSLVLGDVLTIDVDQAGGGASPTDIDLEVNVWMWVTFAEAGTWA